jgi:hypothetical protein
VEEPKSPRILIYDTENTPLLSWNWGIYEQNSLKVEEDWYMLCFAAKWYGEKGQTKAFALPDYPLYKKDPTNDLELVKDLWRHLDAADIVVAHNAIDFDNKKANARFAFHGLPPPSPYKVVDTLREARRHFKFNSNKLGDLCEHFGIGRKLETGGFKLWLDVMAGDMKAWKKMIAYCKGDVEILVPLYERLRPWMTNHPNINLGKPRNEHLCPVCGSTNVQRRGFE